jgi:hypothetical protein
MVAGTTDPSDSGISDAAFIVKGSPGTAATSSGVMMRPLMFRVGFDSVAAP